MALVAYLASLPARLASMVPSVATAVSWATPGLLQAMAVRAMASEASRPSKALDFIPSSMALEFSLSMALDFILNVALDFSPSVALDFSPSVALDFSPSVASVEDLVMAL